MEFTENQQLITSIGTLTSPSLLPTLPFDVMPEILCRLPVKLLLQLRCLSKSFNSLISDPKFAKKHLRLSKKRHHLLTLSSGKSKTMYDSPITTVFSASTVPQTQQLSYHNSLTNNYGYITALCSCDGIFCVTTGSMSVILWNPSLRKHKMLPPLDMSEGCIPFEFGFGYDCVIDNYKTIAVSRKNEVSVNVLGTVYWRKILDFPHYLFILEAGKFVTGTVNWLAYYDESVLEDDVCVILSLDLEKESYQELPQPDLEADSWTLGVVKDCLCICAKSEMFWDVWIMKEYGKKETWTKVYGVPIPNMQHQGLEAYTILYISEDDRLLVHCFESKLVVYDSKNDTLNIPEFQNNHHLRDPQVYVESLISP